MRFSIFNNIYVGRNTITMSRETEKKVTSIKIEKKLHRRIVARCKIIRAKVYVWVEDTLAAALAAALDKE